MLDQRKNSSRPPRRAGDINLLNYAAIVLKKKRVITGATFFCGLAGFAASFLISPSYRAETGILPPQQAVNQQVLAVGEVSSLLDKAVGLKNPNDVYLGILRSRTLSERVIDRFALMELYGVSFREDARKRLSEHVSVSSSKDGIISVSVEDTDPQRAAKMANAFIEELKELTKDLAVTEAAKRRLFVEEQLKRVKESLIAAEESMRAFQQRTGVVKLEKQAEAVIESVTWLKSKISAKEVELDVMKSYTTPRNPDLQRVAEEIRSMKNALTKIEAGGTGKHDLLLSTKSFPELGTGHVRKLRELKYNETLFEILSRQYEMARLDEAREAVTIQVLDLAVASERTERPQRGVMAAIAAFSGFIASVFGSFLVEYARKVSKDPGNRGVLDEIRKHAGLKQRQA